MRHLPHALLLGGLLLFTGCASHDAGRSVEEGAPMDATGEVDSVWSYLSGKYDANGDGAVSREEYDRDQFDRLDRDESGTLTAADFARAAGRNRAMMRDMMAQRMMARFFQDDDDDEKMALAELDRVAARYDDDGDGTIGTDEFDRHCKAHEKKPSSPMIERMMRDRDPYDTISEAVDGNDDDLISREELVAFFKKRDDGDGVWNLSPRRGGRSGDRPPSGPTVGTVAPDFTLVPPTGGDTVTLSSFAGKRPVALIFGSYT